MENSYKLWGSFLGSFSNKPTLLRLTPGVVELTGDVYNRVISSRIFYFLILASQFRLNVQAFGPEYYPLFAQMGSTAIRFIHSLMTVWIIGRQESQI